MNTSWYICTIKQDPSVRRNMDSQRKLGVDEHTYMATSNEVLESAKLIHGAKSE